MAQNRTCSRPSCWRRWPAASPQRFAGAPGRASHEDGRRLLLLGVRRARKFLVHGGDRPAAEEELSCGCRDGGRQVRARGDAADSAAHEFLGGVGVAVAN